VPRLFVGIDFPQELKLDLSKLCAGVPGAEWVRPCKFHLTLRFIGAVDDPTVTNITDALLRIEASSFMLSLAGVGHFGGHTLWVGVEKNPALISLQDRIEDRLQQIGLEADTRPYFLHVKLAHLKRRRSLLRELRPFWPKAVPEPMPVVAAAAASLGIDLAQYQRKSITFVRIEAGLIRLRHEHRQLPTRSV